MFYCCITHCHQFNTRLSSYSFCRSEIQALSGWFLCSGFHRTVLARTAVFIWHSGSSSKLTGYGKNSFPYSCSTEVLIFLLAFGQELFSATRSSLQFFAMWSPWAVHKRDVCMFPGQIEHISLVSSSATSQRKVSALKLVLVFRSRPLG